MTSRILISLSLLLFAWQKAGAQWLPAEDFFNSGAQFYISNNIPAALERVESGLKIYPDDEKLKKLEQLLKQQQNQQNQNQQQQNRQQKSQDQSKNQPSNPDQKKDPSQSKDQKPDSTKPQNDGQKPKPADDQKSKGQSQPDPQGQETGQLTPQEAKKLLDAQKDEEPLLVPAPPQKPKDPTRPVRDW